MEQINGHECHLLADMVLRADSDKEFYWILMVISTETERVVRRTSCKSGFPKRANLRQQYIARLFQIVAAQWDDQILST